jgi:hypothetical protein
VSLFERIRRFWLPGPGDNHPLSDQERDEHRPATAYDERARVLEEFLADDFDPDGRGPAGGSELPVSARP